MNRYHGTLDRSESNKILKEHATSLAKNAGDSSSIDPDLSQASEDSAKYQEMDFSSGVFLVRFSENSGDDVLTLLYDYNPKHFIIQKYVRLCHS